MADVPEPEMDEEVEYIEVYEEVTDDDDDAGELVEQQQGEAAAPAAVPAAVEPPPASPADSAADTAAAAPVAQPTDSATATAAAAAAGTVVQEHRSSTSTAGDGTFLEVQLSGPHSPPAGAAGSAAAAAADPATAGPAAADSAAAAAAADSAAAARAVGLGSQGDLVLMEQQASKVAAEVAHLASQVTHKLHDGFLQAFSNAAAISGNSSASSSQAHASAAAPEQQQQQQPDTPSGAGAAAAAAAAAAAGISTKLTGGLSGLTSWWSNLDQSLAANNAPLAEPGSSPADKLKKSVSPEAQLASLFGLGADEALVESYSCSLMQSYACAHNSLTPPMQITFEGKLYITDKHACFHAAAQQQDAPAAAGSSSSSSPATQAAGGGSGSSPAGKPTRKVQKGRKMPQLTFKIAHADVAAATREPNPVRSAGSRVLASDLLKVVVEPRSSESGGSSSSGLIKTGAAAAAAGTAAAAAGVEGSGLGGRWTVMFQSFEPSSGLDGALALIEHLKEG